MGPLSTNADIEMILKQRRETLRMLNDESRKSREHKIKIAKELAKARKEGLPIEDALKAVATAGAPLGAQPTNPEAGPQDMIPAKLAPGEAVIPNTVAQDPRYKPAISHMVDEGRRRQEVAPMVSSMVSPMRAPLGDAASGFQNGTTSVPASVPKEKQPYEPKPTTLLERVADLLKMKGPAAAPIGDGMADKARKQVSGRKKQIDDAADKAMGYQRGTKCVKR